ncbi:Myosin IC heavy chain [Termitomyces sp. T112]|nr:Myosin IC heavy chain [Termitomyces sp. T112]
MVFAKLQNHEKEAFFSLLDEYFASRPDVFGKLAATSSSDGSGAGYGGAASAAASAAHRAFGSSGAFNHGVTQSTSSNSPEPDPEPEVHSSVAGRIAAFSTRNNNSHASPPHRTTPPIAKPTGASGLISSKRIGDVDTSSKGAMVGSLFHGNKNKNPQPAAPLPPPAFPLKKNTFAPPPARHPTSESPALPKRQPEPEPEPEQEQEETHGEWALALYDYNSQDPGDLQIKENEHVLVTERTSDDWWTGEYNGHKGLFPASYVKLV